MGRSGFWALAMGLLLVGITGCQSSPPENTAVDAPNSTATSTSGSILTPTTPEQMADHDDCIGAFVPIKELAAEVISREGLPGGGLLIMQDGEPLCRVFYGNFHAQRPVSLVSAAKWLSSATIMTLVDDGLLILDEPISTYLRYFYGSHGQMTLRQLLSHTSGLPMYTDCMFEPRITL